MAKYILSIDLGTTSMKVVLFDNALTAIQTSKIDYPTEYPHPQWAEHNTENWWKALLSALDQCKAIKIDLDDIALISIDAMTPTIVPVDTDGNALYNAIIWMDRRSEEQCKKIDAALGNSLFKINGNHNDPSNFAPKVMWIRDNKPEIYAKTAKFLYANAYLVKRLTGEFSMDRTQCGLSQLCDTIKGTWDDSLIAGCGLDKNKLPAIYECTDIVGNVSADAARMTGLSVNTKVIAGAMDNVAAGLGAGIMEDRDLYVSAGTATNVCICSKAPVYNHSFHVYSHIVKDHYIHAAGVDYGGAGYKWFAKMIKEDNYALLDSEAKTASGKKRSSLIYLPYMVGQRAPLWNSHTKGVLFGLEPSMERGELALAFMEGNALGVKKVLELTKELGMYPKKGKLTGGCSESEVYSQIFANVLNIELQRVGKIDTASMGMAMTGAIALGWYKDFPTLAAQLAPSPSILPEKKKADYYSKAFSLFDRLYTQLGQAYIDLSELQSNN